jgi:hypothetical protein
MESLTIAVVCIGFIACFIIGAKVGQQASKGEPIETPTINPLELYKEHRNKQEAEIEQNRLDTIMRNIESYDGTSMGQIDVPGR